MSAGVWTVSYTHLDVYKRQVREVESGGTVTGAVGRSNDGEELRIGSAGDCLALAEQPASRSGSARERDHASDGHDGYSLVVGVANRKLARL